MRKLCLLLFSFLIIYSSTHSQEAIFKITREYFRSDPFRGEFSAFMKHLFNDPSITNKVIEKRTDTSLFYFEGTYTAYNPFFFKPKRVEVVLTELPVDLDSLSRDTIFVYEILAYNNATNEGTEEIKKEFDNIFKHYKNSFTRNEYTEGPPGNKVKGSTYNFFDRLHGVSPFGISLYGPNENREMCLILSIRLDTYNNLAVLPVPLIPLDKPLEEDQ